MTNNFSIKRFAAYAQAEIGSQKRTLLTNLLLMVSIAVVAYLLPSYNLLFDDTAVYLSAFNSSHMFVMVVTSVFSLLYICSAFRKFHRPLSAPFTMLVPASKNEKFSFAFLFNFIVMPVVFSLLDYLFFLLFSWVYGLHDIAVYYQREPVSNNIMGLALLMFFFFGAVFFRRRQFVNTALSGLAITVIFVMGMIAYQKIFGSLSFAKNILFETKSWFEIAFWTFITIGLLLWSWFKFKKLQIR